MQRYAQSWAIADNLPDTPTSVLVGVNLGRFTTSPDVQLQPGRRPRAAAQERLAAPLCRAASGQHKYSYTILPGIFSALASYVRQRENGLLYKGRLHAQCRTSRTPSTSGRRSPTRRSRNSSQKWLSKYYPAFRKRASSSTRPCSTGSIARGEEARPRHGHRGAAAGTGRSSAARFDEAMAAYKMPTARHRRASTRSRISTSTTRSTSPASDFLDLSHLRPEGRAIWQSELARELARPVCRTVPPRETL